MNKKYYIYLLTNYDNNVLYTGVTNNLTREKKIKGWIRKKKNELVNQFNPKWKDLYAEIC